MCTKPSSLTRDEGFFVPGTILKSMPMPRLKSLRKLGLVILATFGSVLLVARFLGGPMFDLVWQLPLMAGMLVGTSLEQSWHGMVLGWQKPRLCAPGMILTEHGGYDTAGDGLFASRKGGFDSLPMTGKYRLEAPQELFDGPQDWLQFEVEYEGRKAWLPSFEVDPSLPGQAAVWNCFDSVQIWHPSARIGLGTMGMGQRDSVRAWRGRSGLPTP